MGRKAKLKKQRKEKLKTKNQASENTSKYNSTQFVEQIQRQGYSLKQNTLNSPQMPDDYIEPQI